MHAVSRTDPAEAHDIWQARYAEACRAFAAGELSDIVFAAKLYGLGFRRADIAAEISLHRSPQE